MADGVGLAFAPTFASHMVLQQAPSSALIYGAVNSTADVQLRLESSNHGSPSGQRVPSATSITVRAHVSQHGKWEVRLPPMPSDGSEHTITASAVLPESGAGQLHPARREVLLHGVVFGDVWLCAGQSNMALPLENTFSSNASIAAAASGRFENIRLAETDTRLEARAAAWSTARRAALARNGTRSLSRFCSTCWYFAEGLTAHFVRLGRTPPTLGLVCIGLPGTFIEAFMPEKTLVRAGCTHTFPGVREAQIYNMMIQPLTRLALKGWLWQQGEHNLQTNAVSGNSLTRTGYGCELPALVRAWRAAWSAAPNSTSPLAPFGISTLEARAGWFGALDFGGMRWAQTANMGYVDSRSPDNADHPLRGAFLAQAYDLHDPWNVKPSCLTMGCCAGDVNRCAQKSEEAFGKPIGGRGFAARCARYCELLEETPAVMPAMGTLHSRLKRPLGARLARAAYTSVYGGEGASTGPTISGCAVHASEALISFDRSLLRGERLELRSHAPNRSMLQVLLNASALCLQPMQRCPRGMGPNCQPQDRQWFCPHDLDAAGIEAASHDRAGRARRAPLDDVAPVVGRLLARQPDGLDAWESHWADVPLRRTADPLVLSADLSSLRGAPIYAIRYAWGVGAGGPGGERICCDDGSPLMGITEPCPAAACPIMASGGLPANPFLARVAAGRCVCIPPQRCDQPPSGAQDAISTLRP